MRPRLYSYSCILLTLCFIVSAPNALAFEAGAARVGITPPPGTPMLGVPERMGRGTTSVHSQLYSRALYLSDGVTSVMLVVVDLFEVPTSLRTKVVNLAPEEIPRENIILVSTGTHSGPGAMETSLKGRQKAGPYDDEVFQTTANAIAESMRQAYGVRQRGAIGFGLAKQTSLFQNTISGKAIDEQIGVLRVDDADGNPIAIVANNGVHADWIADRDRYAISSDLPGLFCDELEELTPAGCIAFFLNGASADQVLGNPEDLSGWDQAVSIAKTFAVLAKGAANQVAGVEAEISVQQIVVETPAALSAADVPREVQVQQLKIGNAVMSFLPGTLSVQTVLKLRSRAAAQGYSAAFCAGGISENVGALLQPEDYIGTLASDAPLGPEGGTWAIQAATALLAGDNEINNQVIPNITLETYPGLTHLQASGNAREQGIAWGAACTGMIDAEWRSTKTRLTDPFLPSPQQTSWWPHLLDDSDARIEAMKSRAVNGLKSLPPDSIEYINGIAIGAGLPFDAVWLSWNAPELVPNEKWENQNCSTLTFGVLGDQAGADDALIAQSLSAESLPPLSTTVYQSPSESNRTVLLLQETGGAAIFAGVNNSGVAICVDRFPGQNASHPKRQLSGLHLRAVLQNSSTFSQAANALNNTPELHGYQLFLCAPENGNFTAGYVAPGTGTTSQPLVSGLVLNDSIENEMSEWDNKPAKELILETLAEERIVDASELRAFLLEDSSKFSGALTYQHIVSLVIAPKQGALHLAVQEVEGDTPTWVVVRLAGGTRSE